MSEYDFFATTQQQLEEIKVKYPYSKIDVDIWPLAGLPNKEGQSMANYVWWVRSKKYKIKRKSRLIVHLMPQHEAPDIPDGEIMSRTPIMYKKSEHLDV